ncbi:MAG: urocanate hydratase, partial [Firmicutes bacterium]|nr:urocanate hydratase [Bacillota bacterium]
MEFDPRNAMTIRLDDELPEYPKFVEGIRRAPRRESELSASDRELAIRNALRYIPTQFHEQMAKEFAQELSERGRIYGYRFRPEGKLYGKPIDEYKGNCIEAKAFQVMIDNNLDFDVALYPYELTTYGETGQVCQNWMQYRLIKKYLEVMTDEQTLVVMSGHPLGLFHSHKLAPRCIISNGIMTGLFDDQKNFNRAAALGVANYGQMTAGGWMYIGPQGIVHGTFNTLLNAGRLKLGIPADGDLAGRLFVSAGLGGMSGAQGKAAEIAGAVSIIAEVDDSRIDTRYSQGWVSERTASLDEALAMAKKHLADRTPCAIAYNGNVVDLLEYLYEKDVHVDLMSDQTSCHAVYDGGYCPQGLTFAQRTEMLAKDREGFKKLVDRSLIRHFEMIKKFHEKGTYFFDYGNSFLKAVYDAGEPGICRNGRNDLDGFIFPSYVEDILGPNLFDFGYGPFRWCCLSRDPKDLEKTDMAAAEYIKEHNRRYQDYDNYVWVRDAKANKLVVGTQCRILYQDAMGRMNIALKFNEMVR